MFFARSGKHRSSWFAIATLLVFMLVVPGRAQAQTTLTLGFVPPASADGTNLVTNGGFETGDFTGWTESGNIGGTCAVYVARLNDTISCVGNGPYTNPTPAHTGDFAANFPYPAHAGFGTISQDLSTTPSTSYVLTFWLDAVGGGTPNQFIVDWGGAQVLDLVSVSTDGYIEYTLDLPATGSSTQLSFSGTNDPSISGLDDVSVVATPEPSSLMLLGIGLVGLVGLIRRKVAAV